MEAQPGTKEMKRSKQLGHFFKMLTPNTVKSQLLYLQGLTRKDAQKYTKTCVFIFTL